jgi:hypothetical protein
MAVYPEVTHERTASGQRKGEAEGRARSDRHVRADDQVDVSQQSPDIVLLAVGWPERALIRAQLIEQGFAVWADDDWDSVRRRLSPRWFPRVAIVDLKDLPNPERVLRELSALLGPARLIVLTASGTIQPLEIERYAFRVVKRPIEVGRIAEAAAAAMAVASHG